MKRLGYALALATAAILGAGQAQAQIDGGKAWVSPIPYFKDLPPWDANYKAPRTPEGKPDLQGVWSIASLTQLERGAGYGGGIKIDTLVIPAEQINDLIKNSYYAQQ